MDEWKKDRWIDQHCMDVWVDRRIKHHALLHGLPTVPSKNHIDQERVREYGDKVGLSRLTLGSVSIGLTF